MKLNDLFVANGVALEHVLVFRHRPPEPHLYRVFPLLASVRPDLFNAYQQWQRQPNLENAMHRLEGAGYVASFIGLEPGKALFIGLYRIGTSKLITATQYWKIPANKELRAFGMQGFNSERPWARWFDLTLTDFYESWKGKLTIEWPGGELAWWRRAQRADMPIRAVLEQSALDPQVPDWRKIDFGWDELRVLTPNIRSALAQWRGVYFIFDATDGKGYVGSAYGRDNLLGRWQDYAARGHGGNRQLIGRDPKNFRFSILERVSPDMSPDEVVSLERTWKVRLHTLAPDGLNSN